MQRLHHARARAAFEANKAARKPDPEPDHVARINALTSNARNTWLVMLAALVFVTITLMGVEHIDFWGVNRATRLPLVNVEVPTRLFFAGAPILIAAIYGYFHLYLIRLWDALGEAPARINGKPLGDAIMPWLVSDAALFLRRVWRDPDCAAPRNLEGPTVILNLLLCWAFGLVVLGFTWWLSMPARSVWLTACGAVSLLVSAAVGAASFTMMWRRMRRGAAADYRLWRTAPFIFGLLLALMVVAPFTWFRTMGPVSTLAALRLLGEEVVEKPADWMAHQLAKQDYRAAWCSRENVRNCGDLGDAEDVFEAEWRDRRRNALATLDKPGVNQVTEVQAEEQATGAAAAAKAAAEASNRYLEHDELLAARARAFAALSTRAPDLRGADLREAFLSGANLVTARLDGALLNRAQLEGSRMIGAQMQGADLTGAQMQGASLSEAQMQGALLRGAGMEGANLSGTQLVGADLAEAQLQRADLTRAQMEGALLWKAQLDGAVLRKAHMEGADLGAVQLRGANLVGARMQRASLEGAQMQMADLFGVQLQGAALRDARMQGASLIDAQMRGADLTGVHMQGADLNGAQMDGVLLRSAQMQFANWAHANLRSAAHSADFRGAKGLTQQQLNSVIGDEGTLLPEGLHVWTCWSEPFDGIDAMAESATFFTMTSAEEYKTNWLCPAGIEPRRTGTQIGLDETPPWEW